MKKRSQVKGEADVWACMQGGGEKEGGCIGFSSNDWIALGRTAVECVVDVVREEAARLEKQSEEILEEVCCSSPSSSRSSP